MRRFCRCVLASVVLCALSNVSAAGPREYCDLLAKEIANRRIGQSDLITGTINNSDSGSQTNSTATSPALENWQKAYKQKFEECLDDYEVKPIASPKAAVAETKKSKPTQRRRAHPSPMRTPKAMRAPKSPAKTKIDTDESQLSKTEPQQVKSAPVTKIQRREKTQNQSRHPVKRSSRKSEMTPVQFDMVPVERRKCVSSSRVVCRAP
jgi:hypothetical protein